MTTLNPTRLIEDCRRITCPVCREQVLREEVHGTPSVRRVRAFCSGIDCKWMQHIEVPRDGGEARTYTPERPRRGKAWDALQVFRPRCTVRGCAKFAAEAGICEAHASLWRADGRQPLAEWIEAQAEREAASRGRGTFHFPALAGDADAPAMDGEMPPPVHVVRVGRRRSTRISDAEARRRSDSARFGMCRAITPWLTRDEWDAAGKPKPTEWVRRQRLIKR